MRHVRGKAMAVGLTLWLGIACARKEDAVGILDTDDTETITLLIRDFRVYDPSDPSTNPDFENVPDVNQLGIPDPNKYGPWDDRGFVADHLDNDWKPVYRPTVEQTLTTHGQAAFRQWFYDAPGTNMRAYVPLTLERDDAGNWSYDSLKSGIPVLPGEGRMFFPIDDGGPYATAFGNQGNIHNYAFTVTLRASFTYQPGETLDLRGDDDIFVYIDRKLVIDLGGIHDSESAMVQLDTLGLTPGTRYPFDLFFAERHLWRSSLYFKANFRLRAELPE